MKRSFLAVAAMLLSVAAAGASEIRGSYVEARTCDVWTGPCFANADFNLGGKHAVMAWNIERGSMDGVSLDGLSVVAVIAANNTLGLEQTSAGKAVVLVDERATSAQRDALVALVRKQAGGLVENIVATRAVKIAVDVCECKGGTCAVVDAGVARVRTRCIDTHHDKACGNESAYYPPLARGVNARAGAVLEHIYRGTGLEGTWSDYERRGAYVGTFVVK